MPQTQMRKQTLKLGPQTRDFHLNRESIDEKERTVELSFSSEAEVERWWGVEILDHSAGAVNLGRLLRSGALLMDHNTRDQIGVVQSASIDADRKGRAVVKFSRSARAEEIFQDVLDNIRSLVSVGYRVLGIRHEKTEEDKDFYRVTSWEPYEISIVSVPADTTVGVGRSADESETEVEVPISYREEIMPKPTETPVEQENRSAAPAKPAAPASTQEKPVSERSSANADAAEILKISREFGCESLAEEAIRSGANVTDFRRQVLEKVREQRANPAGRESTAMELGLSDKEKREYSLMRAIRASATGNWKKAGFEREVSIALAEKTGREFRGFGINYELLASIGQRSQNVGTPAAGGNLVATELHSEAFIEALRNRAALTGLGARIMTGLVGNIDVPKQTGTASFSWVAEGEDSPDTSLSFGLVQMSPKTITGSVPITRRLRTQSTPDVDILVRDDLLKGVALGLDFAAINGSGVSNQPRGILNTTGVGAVDMSGGVNWAGVVNMETEIALNNADVESMAYLMGASERGLLKQTEKAAGTAQFIWDNNMVNGYQAGCTNQIPTNKLLLGDYSQVLMGIWGVLDLVTDTATLAKSGGVVLRLFQDADVALRHPESFCVGDATPAP